MMRRTVLTVCLLLALACTTPLWAATVTQRNSATDDTWHSTATTLASNAQVQSGNITLTNVGDLSAYCTISVPMSAAPAANSSVVVWFQVSTNASTFPDGGASVVPARNPDMVFPLRNATGTQVVTIRVERIPLGLFQVLIRNDNTGATMNGTWSLKCKTHTLQIQ
jgi:hypothetical protein